MAKKKDVVFQSWMVVRFLITFNVGDQFPINLAHIYGIDVYSKSALAS